MAGLALFALVLVAGVAPRLGRRGAFVLAVLSCVWMLANHPMEGTLLFTVFPGHGFTEGDLAGIGGLLVAAYVWFTSRR